MNFIMLCKYKNGVYGEVLKYSIHDEKITTAPFNDCSVEISHGMNGICTSIHIDAIYRNTFSGVLPSISYNDVNDFEVMELVVFRKFPVCKLSDKGTRDKLLNVDRISTKNQDIIRKYLDSKNISLTDVFKINNYETKLLNFIEGD